MPKATNSTETADDIIFFVLPVLNNPCNKQVAFKLHFMGQNLKDCMSIESDSVLQVSVECVRKMKLKNAAVIQIAVKPSLNNILPDDVLALLL